MVASVNVPRFTILVTYIKYLTHCNNSITLSHMEYYEDGDYEEQISNFYSHYDYDHYGNYWGPYTDAPWGSDE